MITRRTALGMLAATCLPASLAPSRARATLALQEPEFLKEKLADGTLPAMAERLPKVPRVVNLAAMGRKPGQYGGTARTIIGGQKDIRLMTINGYARLVGFDEHLVLQPDILESFEQVDNRIGQAMSLRAQSDSVLKIRQGRVWVTRDATAQWGSEDLVLGPGDSLRLAVSVLHRRGPLCRVRGEVQAAGQRVAEARLLLQVVRLPPPQVDPLARVAPGAELAPGVRIGPYCVVGPEVRLGIGCVVESHVVIDGDTTLGRHNRVFPFASIGLPPQDLKYKGEPTRVRIGDRNTFREFVTVHRGTAGGGGLTSIGSDNLFMAYTHVAHDCRVGSRTIFANGATLAGHVEVMDFAQIGAFSGVHQFCRVGVHAFLGGYTVATKDVLPYSKTVGSRPACIYGVNTLGLTRRGFTPQRIASIRKAYRVLLQSRLNTSEAVARLEASGPETEDVRAVVDFIRSSRRGVILKRHIRHHVSEEP